MAERTAGEALRAATRPFRRLRRLIASSDPDHVRLRFALGAIATLVVIAVILIPGLILTHQLPTAAIPGLMLGMIASNAVKDKDPRKRTVTILLLAPVAFVSITIASLLSGSSLVAFAVFVAVAVAAVFLRALGQRGVALGMLAFIAYFLTLFIHLTPDHLPDVAFALAIAAVVTSIMRWLASPRHPERDLERMLRALGDRAGRTVVALRAGVTEGEFDTRLKRTVRSRTAASSSTATSIEQALGAADDDLVGGLSNDDLAIRVFDFQLALERLVEVVRLSVATVELSPSERQALLASLGGLATELGRPIPSQRLPANGRSWLLPREHELPDARGDETAARLTRTLRSVSGAWQAVVAQGSLEGALRAAELPGRAASAQPDSATRRPGLRDFGDLWRVAVQVGLALALAIAAGTALSSTRWFWATIAAFVVYVGTSSRGEILTKGWLRVVGTLGGVIFGVLIAAFVGHNTILAIGLIVVALFCGFYLITVSSAFFIFFLTTMLALLYGLLGEFSVGLLVLRLEETAVGAAIGIGVAYVVFPVKTRDVARDKMRIFLLTLADAVRTAADRIVSTDPAARASDDGTADARALRTQFETLRTSAKPLTQALGGTSDRFGSRRTLQILGACEHHARALLRLSARPTSAAETETLRTLLDTAAQAVAANVDALRAGLGERLSEVTMVPATAALDDFEDHADTRESPHHLQLVAIARNLRAIDLAITNRAKELGAKVRAEAEAPATSPVTTVPSG